MTKLLLAPLLAAFVAAPAVHAAELRLVHQAGTREVQAVLDTQGESLNAVEGTVDVPGGVAGVSLGSSVVPLWLERPSASSLRFSGVIPGGFAGTGTLFAFVPAGSGQVAVTPRDVRAYRNDGAGTAASVTAVPLVAQLPAGGPAFGADDTGIPDFSEVRVARDPALFDGRWFVAFNAQDAGTGVVRYEVAERRGADTGRTEQLAWRPATSPALLEDQSRRSTVFVRALDGAGNARIGHVGPAAGEGTDPYAGLGLAALVLLVLAAILVLRRARLKP